MQVKVAKTAGFCFGVKRAVEKVYDQVDNNNETQIYTYGPIIHNEQVVQDLESRGVKVINTEEELQNVKNGIVVIRSHGVSQNIYNIIESNGLELVDATCPFVKKIHKIVKEQGANDRYIIIVGDGNHPEVQGIKGHCTSQTIIINTKEDAEKFDVPRDTKICIVSQTTFNYNKFQDLVEIILKKGYDVSVLNTICNATHERQVEARQIAREVDAMIVIGGKKSSNTQKLYEICKSECGDTFYIQTLDDLDLSKLESIGSVGITAGASTPNKIIEEVHTNVRVKF